MAPRLCQALAEALWGPCPGPFLAPLLPTPVPELSPPSLPHGSIRHTNEWPPWQNIKTSGPREVLTCPLQGGECAQSHGSAAPCWRTD